MRRLRSLAKLVEQPHHVRMDCTNKAKSEYIAFSNASAGQQASSLFTALIDQPGAPLIDDQPEDDIASKLFKEIVKQVWRAKSKRQLVFARHSASFVADEDMDQ